MRLKIEHNVEAIAGQLSAFERKQLPYATAVALTRTAKRAQTKVRRNLPRRFTIRNQWVSKGILIKPATKKKPEAVVYSRDDFMVRQEEGGAKRPKSGRHIAVPGSGTKRSKRGIVTKAKRPRRVMEKPGVFIAPISAYGRYGRDSRPSDASWGRRNRSTARADAHGDALGIWQRKGRARVMQRGRYKGRKRQPITLLFWLGESVQVKKRWGFTELVRSAVTREFEKEFADAVEMALATSK